MPKSTVQNHLHRYKKVDLSTTKTKSYLVYKCTKPLCSHYLRMDLAEGQLCECNKCGETMLLTRAVLVHSGGKPMAKPHCVSCIKRRKATDETVNAISQFLNQK